MDKQHQEMQTKKFVKDTNTFHNRCATLNSTFFSKSQNQKIFQEKWNLTPE